MYEDVRTTFEHFQSYLKCDNFSVLLYSYNRSQQTAPFWNVFGEIDLSFLINRICE